MYNHRRDNSTYADPRTKKDKQSTLQEFKIHSNTLSPNPSAIRNKKPSRESILNDQHNSRKGLYRNQGQIRKTSNLDNTNVERQSFNHPSNHIRRNMSERSDRSDFKVIKDKSYISNRLNINSGAKAKIKQMIAGRDTGVMSN